VSPPEGRIGAGRANTAASLDICTGYGASGICSALPATGQ
jgi:hypothetical protein